MIAKTEPEPLIILPPGEKKPQPIEMCRYSAIEFSHNGYIWSVRRDEETQKISLFMVRKHELSSSVTMSLVVKTTRDNPIFANIKDWSSLEEIAQPLITHYSVEKYQES